MSSTALTTPAAAAAMTSTRTPDTPAVLPAAPTPPTGTWRHPKLDDIARQQSASIFSQRDLWSAAITIALLAVTFSLSPFIPSWLKYVLLTIIHSQGICLHKLEVLFPRKPFHISRTPFKPSARSSSSTFSSPSLLSMRAQSLPSTSRSRPPSGNSSVLNPHLPLRRREAHTSRLPATRARLPAPPAAAALRPSAALSTSAVPPIVPSADRLWRDEVSATRASGASVAALSAVQAAHGCEKRLRDGD